MQPVPLGTVQVPHCTLDHQVIDLTPPWTTPKGTPKGTIVFHHGLGSTRGIWAGWLPALIAGYRVVTFDMRGHGASAKPDARAPLTLDMLTDDLFAVMDAAGVGSAHLVGESIGGTIALNAALRSPERFTSLTVSNGAHVGATIQSVQNWRTLLASGDATDWSLHMMGQRFHHGAIGQDAWDWYHHQQSACCPDVLIGGMEALVGADLRPRLGELHLPVLLLHPDNSPFIPVPLMADFRDRVANARLHVIGHARHGLPFSHAGICAGLLAGFLAEIDGA